MWDMAIAYALLASGNVANKYILRVMSPDLLVGIRMTISGFVIILFSVYKSPRLRFSYLRHDAVKIIIIVVVTTLAPALLKAFALSYMPASKQMLLGSIDPFVTAGYAYLLWGEKLNSRKWVGMLIAFLGIVVSVLSSTPAERVFGEWMYISLPEVAVLVAVALGRYGWIMTQMMLKQGRYLPHELTSISMLLSGILALGMHGIRGGSWQVFYQQQDPWTYASVLLYTICIGNILGYTAYSYCLRRHSATTIALTGLLMPLFVAGMSAALGLERLSLQFFAALLLVAAGMMLFYSDNLKKEYEKPLLNA